MSYKYNIGFTLANSGLKIDLSNYSKTLQSAVNSFNCKQETSFNHKSLALIEIIQNNLIFSLESEKELKNPSKALKTFSQIIIDEFPDFADKILYHKHLFKSFPIYNEKDIEKSKSRINLNIEKITEKDVLKAMVNLCLSDRSTKENNVLYQIKEILYNNNFC